MFVCNLKLDHKFFFKIGFILLFIIVLIIAGISIYKVFNYSKANDELLKYFGFEKKEIKKIREYINKNKRIDNNIQLMEILSKKRYEEYKEIIKYDKF